MEQEAEDRIEAAQEVALEAEERFAAAEERSVAVEKHYQVRVVVGVRSRVKFLFTLKNVQTS